MEVSLLSIIIMLGDEMTDLYNKKNKSFIAAAATSFTLALIVAS
jgi:hypothetical protein